MASFTKSIDVASYSSSPGPSSSSITPSLLETGVLPRCNDLATLPKPVAPSKPPHANDDQLPREEKDEGRRCKRRRPSSGPEAGPAYKKTRMSGASRGTPTHDYALDTTECPHPLAFTLSSDRELAAALLSLDGKPLPDNTQCTMATTLSVDRELVISLRSNDRELVAIALKNARLTGEAVEARQALEEHERNMVTRARQKDQNHVFQIIDLQRRHDLELHSERLRMARIHRVREHQLETRLNEATAQSETYKKVADADRRALQEQCDQIEAEKEQVNVKYLRTLSESNIYQTSFEHANSLLGTAYEDMKDLQRLECEERLERERHPQALGLPPPYDNLNKDPQSIAPFGRHEDAGAPHVMSLGTTVRNNFESRYEMIQSDANDYRHSLILAERQSAGAILFVSVSQALDDTCSALSMFLDKAQDIASASRSKQKSSRPHGQGFTAPTFHVGNVAEHLIKLLLELCWKVVAALELHHYEVNLTMAQRARVGIFWQAIDDTLLKAVKLFVSGRYVLPDGDTATSPGPGTCSRCSSMRCTGHCDRMYDITLLQTQVKAFSRSLHDILHGHRHTHWEAHICHETLAWMDETMQLERCQAADIYELPANMANPPSRQSNGPVVDSLSVCNQAR